ncbi:hypothetical protein Nepgr_004812 [Nepenthes gracilis]|uniref:Choline transporter-like protein n=1 Tax=Nepenthes gracilis TaxID=150966 RepID=A0AAD3S1Z8_NEPGR|nr:hypothetical protein Nepgr_004812 [Nepenthes gracilis]
MGSSIEETNKPSNLYDSPSSPTRPLLSNPYPSPSIEEQPHHAADPSFDSDQTQFLQITYNHGPRLFKDWLFLLLFVLLSLCTIAFGIFSIAHKNSSYYNVSSYTYDSSSSSCVKNSTSLSYGLIFNSGSSFSVYFFNGSKIFRASSSSFVRGLIWALVITFILSAPIMWSVLLLLKHYTKQIVYVSVPFFVLIPIGINVYWFVACTVSSSCSDAFPLVYRIIVLVFVFLVIGVIVWIFVLNWHRIELTTKIIGVASDALSKNLALFVVLPCLTLGLVVYYVPIVVFLVFARFNGNIVPRESDGEYYCVWKQDSWVPAYYALAIITMLWSAAVTVETKAYVISGTIAQWYFSKDDSTPKRKIRSSLRNAFGPSFGSICLSGLLIFVVRIIRVTVDSARQEDVPGIINLILRCCVNTFLSAIDFLNKFTINFVAITGEAYCTSARMTYELLKRNLLSAVFVETISTRLLAGVIFVISTIYAIVLCAILNGATDLGVDVYYVAALAWLLLMVVLGFLVHVLDNVIDTVYVCYAIDRDRGEVCKTDVHEVYVHLPISRSQRF